MGKSLIQQRRGKGSHTFKAVKKGKESKYLPLNKEKEVLRGEVVSLSKEPGRNSVIAEIAFDNNEKEFVVSQ